MCRRMQYLVIAALVTVAGVGEDTYERVCPLFILLCAPF